MQDRAEAQHFRRVGIELNDEDVRFVNDELTKASLALNSAAIGLFNGDYAASIGFSQRSEAASTNAIYRMQDTGWN